MKKTFILIFLFVFITFNIAQAQSPRTVEQLIEQYDSATTIEALEEFYDSLTPSEEEILSQSETHSFIVTPILPPGFESEEEFEEFLEEFEEQQNQPQDVEQQQTEQVSCFDHYDFGSVQAKLFTGIETAVSGTDLIINMEVTNDNPYPVVDTAVFLKVYRELDDTSRRTVDGDDLIDQFWAVKDISLNAGEQKEYAISWTIPAFLRDGKYHIDSYVVSSDRYNLSGLTFTDDVSGSKTFMSIRGVDEGVYFDKSSVTKNGERHQFISPISVEDQTAPITVSADIVNTTDRAQTIEVDWNLSIWDGLLPENYLDQKIETHTIPANSRKTITYTVSDNNHSVYFLSPKLSWEDTSSWLNIRFAREGIDIPRVNYPAVDTYPLIAGEPAKFFVCLHNTQDFVDDTLFKAQIIDHKGDIIYEYQREGTITGDMMGFEDEFIPSKDHSEFTIQTELYQDGELLDEDEMYYSCEVLNPDGCHKSNTTRNIIIGLLALLVLIVLSKLTILKKKND
ncbi:hypothetical protein GW764_04140 [Candidatus Parcubacteria bacterium]|nr:hypothetical protein [Candidatus Parcubacteria bacterium]